ncbi:hypothetical protein DRW41_07340 [Neobacillus piezotolerans]|uniref:Uncharacterized protein n=1 Tax=Neobacillus piezotolerans TaxID=2259171 RepID=A0A3D8GT75_9BACI|nr:hypothetical protein [Neobacillus piezotolerans]RDU37648.1 hypothetical protein DRW41_07340 [Neobacillus piezotolerans]
MFLPFILISLCAAAIAAAFLSGKLKTRLGHSEGMAISMLFGMLAGLAAGTAFGTVLQGDLYSATLYAALFGASAGMAGAFSLGKAALIEGFGAGLMGGMMGAMAGEMLTSSQSEKLVNLLLGLTFSSLLLFGVLPSKKETEPPLPSKRWLLKPLAVFLLITGLLVGGSHWFKYSEGKVKEDYQMEKQNEHGH